MHAFSETAFFPYNRANKLKFLLIAAGIVLFIVLVTLAYLLRFQHQDTGIFALIEHLLTSFNQEIAAASITGILLVAILGGLFFVTVPMEAVFINFLAHGATPYLVIILYLLGFLASFTINYFLGMKLATLAKKIITPKKFYKIKGLLNRYGAMTVLVINAIPFFPAQPLSAILGVFKYNKTKFYVYFLLGALIKYTAVALGYIYIFKPL